jgi:hypothetical protein
VSCGHPAQLKKRVVAVVANIVNGAPSTDATRVVRVTVPSRAIHGSLSIVPESSEAGAAPAIDGCTWSLWPQISLDAKGYADLQPVVDGEALPGGYEFQSASEAWRAEVAIVAATIPGSSDGRILAVATFEIAAECCLTDRQIKELLDGCTCTVDGQGSNASIGGGGGG